MARNELSYGLSHVMLSNKVSVCLTFYVDEAFLTCHDIHFLWWTSMHPETLIRDYFESLALLKERPEWEN